MSVEILERAAELIRGRVLAAPAGRWTENVLGSEGYAVMGQATNPDAAFARDRRRPWVARCGMESWETDKASAEHIASWDPTVALAIAEWLENVAHTHRPELDDDVYLVDCTECPDGDCEGGHERQMCWSCHAFGDDGYAVRIFYPCAVMKDATRIAETYLRERADLQVVSPDA
jgi:hypothetical protein